MLPCFSHVEAMQPIRQFLVAGWISLVLPVTAQVAMPSDPPAASAVVPRVPLPPSPLRADPAAGIHRVTVKFRDALKARARPDGRLATLAGPLPEALRDVLARHDLACRPALRVPAAKVHALVERARRRSGREAADLLGLHDVFEGPAGKALEIARDLDALPSVEWVRLLAVDNPPPPPGDISPPTPDLEPNQDYRNPDPGVNADASAAAGANGQGIRLTDVEYSFNASHEDLVDATIVDDSSGPLHPTVYSNNNFYNHGTSVFGVLGAPDNGYGVTGIAPAADLRFVGEYLESGWQRESAVILAMANSAPGDVVLLEMQSAYPEGTSSSAWGPAELDPAIHDATRVGVDAGVIVIAAAGNGNINLDHSSRNFYNNREHSGAIIVGAGNTSTSHNKLGLSTYGSRVDVQAWGTSVLTTGYGSYAEYGNDDNQSYNLFGGTSSAAACVAGAAAALQSHAVATLGVRLDPAQMRDLLVTTGHPQGSGGHIGPAIDIGAAMARIDAFGSLEITAIRRSGDEVEIDFESISGFEYRLEGNAGLGPGGWTTVEPGVPGTGGLMTFTTTAPAGINAYLYRIALD
ncbi:MAG: S8 family serine peptidase [Akkermansiaceae bacterium]|nr:S8 family serine peptidase [Akkermansiaceae bacterium]